jgi:hypothetical protein
MVDCRRRREQSGGGKAIERSGAAIAARRTVRRALGWRAWKGCHSCPPSEPAGSAWRSAASSALPLPLPPFQIFRAVGLLLFFFFFLVGANACVCDSFFVNAIFARLDYGALAHRIRSSKRAHLARLTHLYGPGSCMTDRSWSSRYRSTHQPPDRAAAGALARRAAPPIPSNAVAAPISSGWRIAAFQPRSPRGRASGCGSCLASSSCHHQGAATRCWRSTKRGRPFAQANAQCSAFTLCRRFP